MAVKIVFIGSGSIIFVKNLIGDCLMTPALQDAHIALLDIDHEKLKLSEKMLNQLNDNINLGRATIKAYTDQREALRGADFVINAIQVGGYEAVIPDFEIPMKYGLKQTYADTLGVGGLFRGLRTIPVMLSIARDMEEVCPNALMLNYTNPMAIVTGAIHQATSIQAIGLCHSVQICVRDLLHGLGMDDANVKSKIAGINHQAWLLEVHRDGVDLYPEIKRRAAERNVEHDDRVRYEIMNRFGYYVTESTQHSSEYMPYFIKRNYPELLPRFGILTEMYKDWGKSQQQYWNQTKAEMIDNADLSHERTHEYASFIMEAIVTDRAIKIGGNVMNSGLITNVSANACVEVPCLVDGSGITPCYIGDLPTVCAGLNSTNIHMQLLTIEAALYGRKESIYHAAMLDPHTSAELSLDDIVAMCDELIEVNRNYLTFLS
ncbi:alpha-glucosidase/alpha-galactosidase [Cohnella sp. WQ 127256]|uniref:alpha-glucosidase/alpha-galactosidase n=1 Tax=Cohnella sp. WQ 127256 TaxID=2938790 RepID=UPI0021181C3A|nr:alpha-glucosidase/alpha-galactosidase [Cohnella sp. WQ 127256]